VIISPFPLSCPLFSVLFFQDKRKLSCSGSPGSFPLVSRTFSFLYLPVFFFFILSNLFFGYCKVPPLCRLHSRCSFLTSLRHPDPLQRSTDHRAFLPPMLFFSCIFLLKPIDIPFLPARTSHSARFFLNSRRCLISPVPFVVWQASSRRCAGSRTGFSLRLLEKPFLEGPVTALLFPLFLQTVFIAEALSSALLGWLTSRCLSLPQDFSLDTKRRRSRS